MAFDQSDDLRQVPSRPTKVGRPTAVDLFCGIGGMGLGFQQAGFDVIAAVEVDPVLAAIHKYNHPNTSIVRADISRLSVAKLKKVINANDVDVVFGGPPCQGFSVIGKRNSGDPRNRLLLEFVRLATGLRPKYIVMENVAGLHSGDMRRHLQQTRSALEARGYLVEDPVIVDAAQFGVPQRRKRLFLIARKSKRIPQVQFPAPSHSVGGDEPLPSTPSVREAIGDLALRASRRARYVAEINRRFEGYHPPRAARPLSGREPTFHSAETIKRFAALAQGEQERVSRYIRLEWKGQSHTMRAGTGPDHGSFMSARPIHPVEPRVINVREAARLHGFPDWFEFHTTKWHSFRGIGNSVPPPLSRALAKTIVGALGLSLPTVTESKTKRDRTLLQFGPKEAAKYFGMHLAELPRRQRSKKVTAPCRSR